MGNKTFETEKYEKSRSLNAMQPFFQPLMFMSILSS